MVSGIDAKRFVCSVMCSDVELMCAPQGMDIPRMRFAEAGRHFFEKLLSERKDLIQRENVAEMSATSWTIEFVVLSFEEYADLLKEVDRCRIYGRSLMEAAAQEYLRNKKKNAWPWRMKLRTFWSRFLSRTGRLAFWRTYRKDYERIRDSLKLRLKNWMKFYRNK